MAPKTKQLKVDVDAHAKLADLNQSLEKAGLGADIKQQDMVSALILYATAPQLAYQLAEYWRYTASRTER